MSYNDSHVYHPEMGEKQDTSKLFKSNYVYNCYGIEWTVDNHAKALEVIKGLRIRPKKRNENGDRIELVECRNGSKKYRALVTFAAHDKLLESGNVSLEVLLD